MTNAHSREGTEDVDQAIRGLSLSFLFGVSALCCPITAEPDQIQRLYGGDIAKAATAIAAVSGLGGLVEFALNPTLGRLSDSIGRRPFFIFPPLVVCLSNLAVAIQGGTSKPLVLLNGVLRRAGATFGGSVATMAVLTDLLEGRAFSMALARVFGMAGLGVILGPMAANSLQRVTSNPRAVYLLTALFALLQMLNNLRNIPETCEPSERKEFAGVVSPTSFVRLFGRSTVLSRLVVAAALVSFVEGKNLNDLGLLWFRNDCSVAPGDVANYVTVWGMGAVLSGAFIVPRLIRDLGMRCFTTFTLGSTVGYLLLNSVIPRVAKGRRAATLAMSYASFAMLLPGINATSASALKGWATSHAALAGLGAGEFAGYFSNLRAVTTTLAPLLYGNLYAYLTAARAKGKGMPSPAVCWLLAAVLGCMLPEAIWRSIDEKDIEIAKKETRD